MIDFKQGSTPLNYWSPGVIATSFIVLLVSLGLILATLKFENLFFAPYEVVGTAFPMLAVIMFFASPVLLITIGVLLYLRPRRPVIVGVFLVAFSLALIQMFADPYISDFTQFISLLLVLLAISSMCETIFRKLKHHLVTSALTLPIALAYWFMASVILHLGIT